MRFRTTAGLMLCAALLLTAADAFAVSVAEKAKKDFQTSFIMVRDLRVMVANFSPEEGQSTYGKIRELYYSAKEDYYGRNYLNAYNKYLEMKNMLRPFAEELSKSYLERTKTVIDACAKENIDIMFDYNRLAPFRTYFFLPYDPVKKKKFYFPPYNARDYHLFKDTPTIENYLKKSYENYFLAKEILENPELEYIKSNEKRTPKDLEYAIEQYMTVIRLCRESKHMGLEAVKLKKVNDLPEIGQKYNTGTINLNPVYDDRIPQDYKLDAADNQGLIYTIEVERLKTMNETDTGTSSQNSSSEK